MSAGYILGDGLGAACARASEIDEAIELADDRHAHDLEQLGELIGAELRFEAQWDADEGGVYLEYRVTDESGAWWGWASDPETALQQAREVLS